MRRSKKKTLTEGEKILDRVKRIGAIILGASENRNWIELCYDGDLMHTKRIDLPAGAVSQIFIEEIPHKSTLFEPPRTMIYFDCACDVEIRQEGPNFIVRGMRDEKDDGRGLRFAGIAGIRGGK